MYFLFLLASCLIFAEGKSSVRHSCSSPQYWCLNEKTAEECGAVEHCAKQRELSANKQVALDGDPITVALYYESLCPGCRYFLTRGMYPAFQKLQSSGILKVELYPYGNARESQQGGKYVFDCQHGPDECVGNLIETCALHIMPNASHYFPFIYCMESHEPTEDQAKTCAQQLGIEYGPIDSCVKGSEGNYLEHQMALKTNALEPPHQYVPWITVNGVGAALYYGNLPGFFVKSIPVITYSTAYVKVLPVSNFALKEFGLIQSTQKHTEQIQNAVEGNMLRYVCQHYEGTPPPACKEHNAKSCTNRW